jgi:hypothetical protein
MLRLTWDKIMEVYSGDDDYVTVYYSDGRDMSTEEYFFTVKPLNSVTIDDTDALLKKEPSDMIFIEENTQVLVPVNDSTQRIAYGNYRYDIQRKDVNGKIRTILSGTYKVINDTTKRTT